MFVRARYNGFLPADVRSNGGAPGNSIMAAVDNLWSCILIDVPASAASLLEPHQTVTVDDLNAAEEA
jgi:hypothetical protein